MAQRRRQDRPHSQSLARRHVHVGIVLRVMAHHDLTGTYAIGGNSGVGLQPDTQVGGRTPGTCPAHHFVALSQGNRRTAGSCEGCARSAIKLMAGSRLVSAGNRGHNLSRLFQRDRLIWLLPGASEANDTGKWVSRSGV